MGELAEKAPKAEAEKCDRRAQTPVEQMVYRYPQLTLKPAEGMSETEAYKAIVRKGQMPASLEQDFHTSPKDSLQVQRTIAGDMELLYLDNRTDFERFVQVLAYRCENKKVPASMGAVTIRNLNNWRKIEQHRQDYLAGGGADWPAEFARFTQTPANYKDTLILAGSGGYSAISAGYAGFDEKEWRETSIIIRFYHEMTHVVINRMYPEKLDPIYEELIADAAGLYQAFGRYDLLLARKFMGIENETYRQGGRLENYLEEGQSLQESCKKAKAWTATLEQSINHPAAPLPGNPFEMVLHLLNTSAP